MARSGDRSHTLYILLFYLSPLKYCISHLTYFLFPLFASAHRFPVPSLSSIEKRLKRCAACRQPLYTCHRRRKGLILQCAFARRGFSNFAPCWGVYHASCIKVGPPFRSRRNNKDGLCLPPVKHWGNFVCEACTVRSVTDRELAPADKYLMCLERIRLLDIAWSWARGTHWTYQTQFNFIRKFESSFSVPVLSAAPLSLPPSSR